MKSAAPVVRYGNLFRSEGAVLKRDIARDQCITFDDVELDENSLVMRLYREQTAMFFPELAEKGALT